MKVLKYIQWLLPMMLGVVSTPQAQNIQLYFPHFAGQEYLWTHYRGETRDTLAMGKLSSEGRATLTVPAWLKGGPTMTQWVLKNGGGLPLIVFGKDYTVLCSSPKPSDESIFFSNNPENDFLTQFFKSRDSIFREAAPLIKSLENPLDTVINTAEIATKLKPLQLRFTGMQQRLHQSPLYAARITEMEDIIRGISDSLNYQKPANRRNDVLHFINNRLNFRDLYHSGYWASVWNVYVQLHAASATPDAELSRQVGTLIARQNNVAIRNALVSTIIKPLELSGRDMVLASIGKTLHQNAGQWQPLPEEIKARLMSYTLPMANKAPDLVVVSQSGQGATSIGTRMTLKTDRLGAPFSLVFFYNSGCGPCEHALNVLITKYQALQKKGVRLISISSDVAIEEFNKKKSLQPWPDVYCDLQGLDGINFQNYGVNGTPTFFVLDAKGVIQTRQANTEAVLEWLGLEK